MRSSIAGCLRTMLLVTAIVSCFGCGKTIRQSGTEQLLTSDAVDQAISRVDFRPMAGQKVFLDTQYIQALKLTNPTYVNSDYIISSTRQQLLACGCRLQERQEEADIILEARVGALGSDMHELTYGIPANNSLGAASAVFSGVSTIPTIPEISIARKNNQFAAAKVGYFAYDRVSREPIWQSGPQKGISRAKEYWVMGAGPFQTGEIYDGTLLAGADQLPWQPPHDTVEKDVDLSVSYWDPHLFRSAKRLKSSDVPVNDVEYAGHQDKSKEPGILPQSHETPSSKQTHAIERPAFDTNVYRKPGNSEIDLSE